MSPRPFRVPDSYDAEKVTRDMLADYLQSLGFRDIEDDRRLYGRNQSQTITATSVSGEHLRMLVKLCWRRSGVSGLERTYSAAQLLKKISNNDWEGSLATRIQRDNSRGVTHYLFVQREGEDIIYAALVPLSAVLPIWRAQRDTSARLRERGELGRRRSNHAMNGSSPTLYLQDDRAPEVAAALWSYPGVRNLASHNAPEEWLKHPGAGYGDAEENKLVEEAAIDAVRQHYESNGWLVSSVEREQRGFDLECRKGEFAEDVEVKGVRGSEQSFVITAGEVRQAGANKNFVLMVVALALSESPLIFRYSGSEFLDQFELSPVQYRAVRMK